MRAYEYYANILPDGHLSVPNELKEKLKSDSKIRIMLLIEDDDMQWSSFAMSQFMEGYSEKDAIYDKL